MRMGNEYAVERTMGRTESGKCQSKTHKTYRDTLTLWIVAFIMIAGLSIALGSNLVSAHDKSEQPEQKFYKSIEIKEGDTLWGIAKEYRDDDYDSIYDYIDEVMSINGLTSDQIHAGQYLTVAYYDTQAR